MNTTFPCGCPEHGHSISCWSQNSWLQTLLEGDRAPRSNANHVQFWAASPSPHPISTSPPLLSPNLRRPLRVLLIGARQDVLVTIQNLHKRGFADAGDWSLPLTYPPDSAITQFNPRPAYPVVISVHTKYMH